MANLETNSGKGPFAKHATPMTDDEFVDEYNLTHFLWRDHTGDTICTNEDDGLDWAPVKTFRSRHENKKEFDIWFNHPNRKTYVGAVPPFEFGVTGEFYVVHGKERVGGEWPLALVCPDCARGWPHDHA